MKINRNMLAVTSNRQLLRTENKLTASMERLSSGYKINKAGDNPAGLAISKKMKAQIEGLDQAESNATDANSVLRIADGALNEVSSILQRIRELSVQAANGTNSYSDKKSMQAEIDKLTEEVDRISSDTEYNAKTLLDGSSDARVYSKPTERMDISDHVLPDDYSLEVTELAEKASYTIAKPTVGGTISINDVVLEYTVGTNDEDFYQQLRDCAEQAGCVATKTNDGKYNIETKEYGSSRELVLETSKAIGEQLGIDNAQGVIKSDIDSSYTLKRAGKDAEVKLHTVTTPGSTSAFTDTATASVDGLRVKVTDIGGFSMDFMLKDNKKQQVDIEVTTIGAMTIQVGANQYQEIDVRIPEVSSESLYLDKVDVTVQGGPEDAMIRLDEAIMKLNDIRSRIGACSNRLDYAINSLAETQEDMTSAYSGLMDTDMAEEMTEYTEKNVLEQASISVLSQANDLPQQVLSLLQ